jgi:hypothetical protein
MMATNYTLSYVMRDGNPHDVAQFGDDLAAAVGSLEMVEDAYDATTGGGWKGWIHWMVHDQDDPERGYLTRDDLVELEDDLQSCREAEDGAWDRLTKGGAISAPGY